MRYFRIGLAGFCVLLLQGTSSTNKKWENIVPLHSSRSDVERLLGTASDDCKCTYQLKEANVFVVFSDGDCKGGGTGGWNVPSGTVIRFTVYPKGEVNPSDIQVDLKRYVRTADKELLGIHYYHDEQEGITISVDQGRVLSFHHGPKAKDSSLRCPGFPYEQPKKQPDP